MKFTSLFASAALAAMLVAPAVAQTAPAAPPMAGAPRHHGMRMLHGITLSDAQKAQIKTLMQQYHSAHPKGSAPDPAARQALDAQVRAVLTPAQQAQFDQNLQNMKAAGPEGREGGMMGRFAQLNLTDAQKTQIQNIMTQFRAAHPQGSPPDAAARQALRDQINAVLTPAQRAQLQAGEPPQDQQQP